MTTRSFLRRPTVMFAGVAATAASLGLLFRSGPALAAAGCALAGLAAVTIAYTAGRHRAQTSLSVLRAELRQALTDPVTGLPVRAVAQQRLNATSGTSATVALVDVDDLHTLNNTRGHGFGDAYLAAIATALRRTTMPGDLVARLGGDEFVLVTDRTPNQLAVALHRQLRRTARIDGEAVPLKASAGICPIESGDVHAALGRADRAMYAAKAAGGGIEHYDPDRHGTPPPPGTRPQRRPRNRHQLTNHT